MELLKLFSTQQEVKCEAANVLSEHMSAVVQAVVIKGADVCEVTVNISCDDAGADVDSNFTDTWSFGTALLSCNQALSSCRSCFPSTAALSAVIWCIHFFLCICVSAVI